jgi:hypothetical protein
VLFPFLGPPPRGSFPCCGVQSHPRSEPEFELEPLLGESDFPDEPESEPLVGESALADNARISMGPRTSRQKQPVPSISTVLGEIISSSYQVIISDNRGTLGREAMSQWRPRFIAVLDPLESHNGNSFEELAHEAAS